MSIYFVCYVYLSVSLPLNHIKNTATPEVKLNIIGTVPPPLCGASNRTRGRLLTYSAPTPAG